MWDIQRLSSFRAAGASAMDRKCPEEHMEILVNYSYGYLDVLPLGRSVCLSKAQASSKEVELHLLVSGQMDG